MPRVIPWSAVVLALTFSAVDGGASDTTFADDREFFAARVQPNLTYCRTCHIPSGIADTDKGRRLMLSSDTAEDYDNLKASWERLGKGVEANRILLKASNTDPEPHTGGAPWPKQSAQYAAMKTLLLCWNDPADCAALLADPGGENPGPEPPLLGDLQASGGRNYAAVFCEGAADSAALPRDPRELIAGDDIDNKDFAVYYNDPFEICETPTLFENQ